MDTTFTEEFLDFIFGRKLAAHKTKLREVTEQGRQFAHYYEKYSRIKTEIYNRLGANEEAENLLEDLQEAADTSASIEQDALYIQGLQDGFILVEILKRGITWPISRDPFEQEEMESV